MRSNTTLITHWGWMTHICVGIWPPLVQIMACRLVGAKPFSEPMMGYCQPWVKLLWKSIEIYVFSYKKMHVKISIAKWWPFCLGLNVSMSSSSTVWKIMSSTIEEDSGALLPYIVVYCCDTGEASYTFLLSCNSSYLATFIISFICLH